MGVGQGQIEHVGVEIMSTGGTVMSRIRDFQLARSPGERIAQIVERPLSRPQPERPVPAPGTRASAIMARPPHDLRRGKIFDQLDAFRRITHIASRAIHDQVSKTSFSWRYRPIEVPHAGKSSAMMPQSRNLSLMQNFARSFLRCVEGLCLSGQWARAFKLPPSKRRILA
jgi:hypothetical protein